MIGEVTQFSGSKFDFLFTFLFGVMAFVFSVLKKTKNKLYLHRRSMRVWFLMQENREGTKMGRERTIKYWLSVCREAA